MRREGNQLFSRFRKKSFTRGKTPCIVHITEHITINALHFTDSLIKPPHSTGRLKDSLSVTYYLRFIIYLIDESRIR